MTNRDELIHSSAGQKIEAASVKRSDYREVSSDGSIWWALTKATGGYPEAVARKPARRRHWFENHLTTTIERDVKVFADIEHQDKLRSLMRILGERTATILNYANLAGGTGIPESSLRRYFRVLESMFLVKTIPAWHHQSIRRETKAPKV